jgi:hypothetical protein
MWHGARPLKGRKAARGSLDLSRFFIVYNNLRYQEITQELISMKTIIHSFLAVLVLTGAVATTQTSSASTQNKVDVARTSMLPIPSCPPDDPNACGMAQGR